MCTNKKNLKFYFISTFTFFLITANFTAEKTKKVENVHTMLTGGRNGTESIFFSWSPVFFLAEHFHSQMGSKPGRSLCPSIPTRTSSTAQCFTKLQFHSFIIFQKTKLTFNIFLFAVFLPHSLLNCSLMACSSLPKWIILSMAAWLPPHNWRLNWLESTSVSKTNKYFITYWIECNGEMNINCL